MAFSPNWFMHGLFRMSSPAYAEIGYITTEFLCSCAGDRIPRDYVHQAGKLRLPVIGIADHNTLAGVVRAYKELDNPNVEYKPKLLIGSAARLDDGTARGHSGLSARFARLIGRLCQLLTRGKRGDDTEKGDCHPRAR